MSCAFCDLTKIQQRIVYIDKLVMAFPTNIPIVPGHILVCPIRHVSHFDLLNDNEFTAIKDAITRLKKSLKKCFQAEGFNIAWNEGEPAGQSVDHLHIHILPRKKFDTGVYKYEPREFLYRPGSREVSPDQELQEVARLVKECL